MNVDSSVGQRAPSRTEARKVVFVSLIGTTIEWYDFFIYGTAAALVFGPQFFPTVSPVVGTLAALATFSVGFIARPLGGIVMGHFGDKVGRKSMLVVSLLLMGVATLLIGLLPNYATIGVAAPILLVVLRFVQGLGVGGEWGGAVLMSVEHAPPGRRAFYGSFPQMGIPLGIILSTMSFLILNWTLTAPVVAEWGWRLAFLASAVLIVIGLVLRLKVSESPAFRAAAEQGDVSKTPLKEVLRHNWRNVVSGALACVAASAVGQIVLVYCLSYATGRLQVPQSTMLWLLIVVSVIWTAVIGAAAVVSDRIGRKPVYMAGALFVAVWAFPLFALIDTRVPALILVALAGGALAGAVMNGAQAALISEAFPVRQRYSGASLAYAIGGVLGGGISPLAATALLAATGSTAAISVYLIGVSLISVAGAFWLRARSAESHEALVLGTTDMNSTRVSQ